MLNAAPLDGARTQAGPSKTPANPPVKQRAGSPANTELASSSWSSSSEEDFLVPQAHEDKTQDMQAPQNHFRLPLTRVETKAVQRVRAALGFMERRGYKIDWLNRLPTLDPNHINMVLFSHTFETALQAAMGFEEIAAQWPGEISILVDKTVASALRLFNLPLKAITYTNILKCTHAGDLMIAFLGGIEGANSISKPPQEWLVSTDAAPRKEGTIMPLSDRTGLPLILTIAARATNKKANIVVATSANWKESLITDGIGPRLFPVSQTKLIQSFVHNPLGLHLPCPLAHVDCTGSPVAFGLAVAPRPWVYSLLSMFDALSPITKTLVTLLASLPVFILPTRGPGKFSDSIAIDPNRLDEKYALLADIYVDADPNQYSGRIGLNTDENSESVEVAFKTPENRWETYRVSKAEKPELYRKLCAAGKNTSPQAEQLERVAFNLMKEASNPVELTERIQAETNIGLNETYQPQQQHPRHQRAKWIALTAYYLQLGYLMFSMGAWANGALYGEGKPESA